MSLSLPAAMTARAQDIVQRPVIAIYLDVEDDPISAWTGPGTFAPVDTIDAALNGKVFDSLGSAPVLSLGPVSQSAEGVSDCIIEFASAGLNSEGTLQFLRDRRRFQGRKAYVWWGYLDSDYKNASVSRYATGVMKQLTITPSPEEAQVQLTIGRDTRLLNAVPRYLIRHSEIHPGDTAVDNLIAVSNGRTGPSEPQNPQPKISLPPWVGGIRL